MHYPHAVSDLRVCGYGDMQLQVRVSSYSHVALSDYVISYFRDNLDEARRIQIFYCNELVWESIRPAVRAWVRRR